MIILGIEKLMYGFVWYIELVRPETYYCVHSGYRLPVQEHLWPVQEHSRTMLYTNSAPHVFRTFVLSSSKTFAESITAGPVYNDPTVSSTLAIFTLFIVHDVYHRQQL